MPRFLHPTPKTLILTAIFMLFAYTGYTQSWVFSGEEMGEPPPPLADVLEHIPYAWETWVILIAPLIFTLRLIGAEHIFNTGPAWLFWGIQGVYFYILAAVFTLILDRFARGLK